MKRYVANRTVVWTIVATLLAAALALFTNLVTSDKGPSPAVVVGFCLAVLASVLLAAWGAADKIRTDLDERRRQRAKSLRPLDSPLGEGVPSLVALLDPYARITKAVGRSSAIAEHVEWCKNRNGPRVRVLEGLAGVGKSRLAAELGHSLPNEWYCGRPVVGRFEDIVGNVVACREPSLIVVDDPETFPDLVKLLDQVLRHTGSPTLRVLLVVRDAEAFNRWLSARGEPYVKREWPTSPPLHVVGGEGDRMRWFVAAVQAYCRALNVPAPKNVWVNERRTPALLAEPFLLLNTRAALAAVAGGSPTAAAAFWTGEVTALGHAIVDYERRRWEQLALDTRWGVHVPGVTAEGRADAVFALVVTSPATSSQAMKVLSTLPRLDGQPAGVADALTTWFDHLYPAVAKRGVAAAAPQALVEAALVAEAAHRGLIEQFSHVLSSDVGSVVLRALARASAWFPSAAESFGKFLTAHPSLVVEASEATMFAGPEARAALSGYLVAALNASEPTPRQVSELLSIIRSRAGLTELRVKLQRIELKHARERLACDADDVRPEYLPELLGRLTLDLDLLNNAQEAVDTAEEVVQIVEALAAVDPRYNAALANALKNLGIWLRKLGELERALTVLRRAVHIFTEVVETKPPGWPGPERASALSNMGSALSDLGRFREALVTTQEAVRQYRDLDGERLEGVRYNFAAALTNLSNRLAEVGELSESVDVSREAVEMHRRLVDAEPDQQEYREGLAIALNSLGEGLLEVDEPTQARAVLQECVDLYENLKSLEPSYYIPNLIGALTLLSHCHTKFGQDDDALRLVRDAVRLGQSLPNASRTRHGEAMLAAALKRLGVLYLRAGDVEDAIRATREARRLYQSLATVASEFPSAPVAQVSVNLAICCSEAGQKEEAVKIGQEAVRQLRELSMALPAKYTRELIQALRNQSLYLRSVGDSRGSLDAEAEAAAWGAHLSGSQMNYEDHDFTRAEFMRRTTILGFRMEAIELAERTALAFVESLVAQGSRPDVSADGEGA